MLSYNTSFSSPNEAISALRQKIDGLDVVFEGLAENSNYDESTLAGVWWVLRDLQQHAALLDEMVAKKLG